VALGKVVTAESVKAALVVPAVRGGAPSRPYTVCPVWAVAAER